MNSHLSPQKSLNIKRQGIENPVPGFEKKQKCGGG
jgi:hypothetical protein